MVDKWDDVYSTKFGGMWFPSEGFVKFTARYLNRRVGIDAYDTKKELKRVLDGGCGVGRHVKFYAEHGYDVFGMDIEENAIKIAKAWIEREGLKADLQVGDLEHPDFEDKFFDVIVSFGVLDHIPMAKAKKIVGEFKRMLMPSGYLFISLRAIDDSEFGRGEMTEKNTHVLQGGYEDGIIQHYFDLDELSELLEGFKVFDIYRDDEVFPSDFSIDKAYLQSSQGLKKYIDLSKPVDMGLKYSRWYIAAEKV